MVQSEEADKTSPVVAKCGWKATSLTLFLCPENFVTVLPTQQIVTYSTYIAATVASFTPVAESERMQSLSSPPDNTKEDDSACIHVVSWLQTPSEHIHTVRTNLRHEIPLDLSVLCGLYDLLTARVAIAAAVVRVGGTDLALRVVESVLNVPTKVSNAEANRACVYDK
jgi:hypothetical protein